MLLPEQAMKKAFRKGVDWVRAKGYGIAP